MGMYTEYNFRFELKKNPALSKFFTEWFGNGEVEAFDDHAFFKTSRWLSMPFSSSCYFPTTASKSGVQWQWDNLHVTLVGSMKNYGDEIGKFIEWISPHVDGYNEGKTFLGYTLYEEDEEPTVRYA